MELILYSHNCLDHSCLPWEVSLWGREKGVDKGREGEDTFSIEAAVLCTQMCGSTAGKKDQEHVKQEVKWSKRSEYEQTGRRHSTVRIFDQLWRWTAANCGVRTLFTWLLIITAFIYSIKNDRNSLLRVSI